jgi:hypothetical protein
VPSLDSQIPHLAQPDTASVKGVHDLLGGINAGETVLIAFEYGPANADELNAIATPILEHLVERNANIAIVSTQPEGMAIAQALGNNIDSLTYDRETSGYRPGNAAGVSQILASSATRPSSIIVLTARLESLRWWIEQAQAHYGHTPPPIVAGVSASLEVAASPYLDANANQLQGVISGLGGAAAYETLRGKGQTTRQLDALVAGHVVIIISMLVGAAFYTFGGSRRRKR